MVAFLPTVHQYGAVGFVQNVFSDLNYQVGADAEDVAVESAVMKLALGVRPAPGRFPPFKPPRCWTLAIIVPLKAVRAGPHSKAIADDTVVAEFIFVGSWPSFDDGDGCNRGKKFKVQSSRFKVEKPISKVKTGRQGGATRAAIGQDLAREEVAVEFRLFVQELKGLQADSGVESVHVSILVKR